MDAAGTPALAAERHKGQRIGASRFGDIGVHSDALATYRHAAHQS